MSNAASPQSSLRRALLLLAATVTGLVLVLSYRTPAGNVNAVGATAQHAGVTTSSDGSGSRSSQTESKPTQSATQTVTATGQVSNTLYGPVQVRVTAINGQIADVQAVALPGGDSRSAQISNYAGPQLRQQALAAQSAQIHGVAGASYTSAGYQQSLQSALNQLGLG